jgi:hypothetical protein
MAVNLLEKFKPLTLWFENHRRDCWLPIVEDGDGGPADSKFSGIPWLAPSEPWPACGNCQRPMALFLQLNLTTTPGPIPKRLGAGLLQAFFCTDWDCIDGPEAGDPFTRTHLLRVVVPGQQASSQKPPPSSGNPDKDIPARRIVSWEKVDDYPDMAEAEELGLVLEVGEDVEDMVVCTNPPYSVGADFDEFETLPWARGNEKLGGWPGWVNVSADYPDCPTCGRRMDLMIFQFGYEGYIPIEFGDGGQGQIVACPEHPNNLAYPWTCG